ncbi:energy-coupling factor transporter transmembrane component T [Candidatus Amarolinea dominans]|uniref:energy-coupling factor transporter transmembrane component T n=1 Tax=Candidatus Amarolinea dominans TaxID=3140696 RepID=UPI003135D575|nr:hypothetical protein [Anaerolineae bacterium]
MAPLTFFILLLQRFFASRAGAPLLHIGPLVVTSGGVLDGISFALRANVMAFAASLLLFVTEAQALVLGLVRLGLPFRMRDDLQPGLRYLPTTYGLWVNIIEAQQARGWTPERQSLLAQLSAYRPVLVAVIIAPCASARIWGWRWPVAFGAPGTQCLAGYSASRADTWICGAVSVTFGLFLAWPFALGLGRRRGEKEACRHSFGLCGFAASEGIGLDAPLRAARWSSPTARGGADSTTGWARQDNGDLHQVDEKQDRFMPAGVVWHDGCHGRARQVRHLITTGAGRIEAHDRPTRRKRRVRVPCRAG